MNKIVTFGEVLLRLSPPHHKTFRQSNQLDFFFGGTEMNVAASLANFGCNVQHVSSVSDDFLGDAAIMAMRANGIEVSAVTKSKHPMGLYFMETGTSIRPGRISYNRLHGAFANINPKEVSWPDILENCNYLHWTGISPGISQNAYETLKKGLQLAQKKGITITADPAYRKNLWQYGKKGDTVLGEFMAYTNIFIGGVNEINEILHTKYTATDSDFIKASKNLIDIYPSIKKVVDKVRLGTDASFEKIRARAWTGEAFIETRELHISHVVDRIGTGDAFAAGLIYGFQHYDEQLALDFANAACAWKHTIAGDVNLASVEEIVEIAKGTNSARINR